MTEPVVPCPRLTRIRTAAIRAIGRRLARWLPIKCRLKLHQALEPSLGASWLLSDLAQSDRSKRRQLHSTGGCASLKLHHTPLSDGDAPSPLGMSCCYPVLVTGQKTPAVPADNHVDLVHDTSELWDSHRWRCVATDNCYSAHISNHYTEGLAVRGIRCLIEVGVIARYAIELGQDVTIDTSILNNAGSWASLQWLTLNCRMFSKVFCDCRKIFYWYHSIPYVLRFYKTNFLLLWIVWVWIDLSIYLTILRCFFFVRCLI